MKVIISILMALFALGALFMLTGCGDRVASPTIVCTVHVKPWSANDQLLLRSEIEALPENSILVTAMQDYANTRAEAKACLDHQ